VSELGCVDKVFTGYSNNTDVRKSAASGGIVTGVLIELLNDHLIEGAVVNVPDDNKAGCGRSIFAKTEDDLLRSTKSIYCVTEISRGLKEVDEKNFAVVGLPCQIDSLNLDVTFKIGLMCGHNVTREFVIEGLRKNFIYIDEVLKFDYRGGGWFPFFCRVWLKDGDIFEIPWDHHFRKLWNIGYAMPDMCKKCHSFVSENADISCGDAWLDKFRGNQEGISMVISHTKRGTSVLEMLEKKGALTLEESSIDDVFKAQAGGLKMKRVK
jgi:coenzyme F420 hydrogenase subunit beta